MILLGDYLLDDLRSELYRDGARIEVQPLPLELLGQLIRHRDRTVGRRELLDALWPGTHVTDGALSSAIYALRRALSDQHREQPWVRTVRGRGFRFEGPCQVVGSSPDRPLDPTPFVQREAEMARLESRLQRAVDGAGFTLLVEGAPGMGKTRLVTEFGQRNAEARIAVARADPDPGLPAGAPLLDCLVQLNRRPAPRDHGGSAGANTLDRHQREIEAQLVAAAEEGPITLVLEDLHWADPLTLATLSHLAREVPRRPILLVATFRPEESSRASAHLVRLALQPGVERIRLEALSVEAVFWVLSRVRGGLPTPDEVAHVLKRSEGIPLYVAELAQTPASEVSAGGGMPVDRVLRERIAMLSAETRAAIGAAAVCGASFDLPLLRAVGGEQLPPDLHWIDDASNAGVLRRDQRDPLRYHFSHALLRDAAMQEMPAAERATIHGRIAARLEDLHPDPPDHVVDAIARHCGAALPYVGDVDLVMEWNLRSARLAAGRREWPRVVELTLRLRRWIEALPREDPRRAAALEVELLDASGLLTLARTLHESRDALDRATTLVDAVSAFEAESGIGVDPELEAGSDQAILFFGLHGIHGALAADPERIERAMAQLAKLSGPIASELCCALSLLADLRRGRFEAAANRGVQLAAGEVTGADALPLSCSPAALALTNAALAAWAIGRDREARDLLAIAERRAASRGDAIDQAMALFGACVVHELRRDWRTLRATASRLDPLCHEHDLTRFHGAGFSFEQWASAQLETTEAPLPMIARVVRSRNAESEPNTFRSCLLALAGRMAGHGGRTDEGLDYLVEAEQVVRGGGEEQFRAEVLRQQAELRGARGQREAASALAEEAQDVAAKQGAPILEFRALVTWWRVAGDLPRSGKRRLNRLFAKHTGALQPDERAEVKRLVRRLRVTPTARPR